jgi:hypothetical protein
MTVTAKRSPSSRSFAALVAAIVVSLAAFAPAAARAQDPIPNPTANRTASQTTLQACYSDAAGQACTAGALADLNAARVSEGDVPMVLPDDWSSLTIPQQLLVLADLERVDRGLNPIEGLSANLDSYAQSGATDDADPFENPFPGNTETSNWEGGYVSPLLSDFAWMYDDGYGSGNLDCTTPTSENCWGHRRDILWDFTEPAVMGAAYVANSPHGPSEAELFMGGDTDTGSGQEDAPIAPTWATIAATLPVGVSATTVALARGVRTGQLELWASGETMNVTAAVTTGSSSWSVSPPGCQLSPGASCELTLTAGSAAPGSGTLTVTGPNGAQTVALQGPPPAPPPPVTPKLTANLSRSKIRRGKATTLSGTASPYKSGTFVELQQRHGKSWRNVAKAEFRLSGRFSFTIHAPSKGSFSYRVSVAATTGFNAAASKTLTLRVS